MEAFTQDHLAALQGMLQQASASQRAQGLESHPANMQEQPVAGLQQALQAQLAAASHSQQHTIPTTVLPPAPPLNAELPPVAPLIAPIKDSDPLQLTHANPQPADASDTPPAKLQEPAHMPEQTQASPPVTATAHASTAGAAVASQQQPPAPHHQQHATPSQAATQAHHQQTPASQNGTPDETLVPVYVSCQTGSVQCGLWNLSQALSGQYEDIYFLLSDDSYNLIVPHEVVSGSELVQLAGCPEGTRDWASHVQLPFGYKHRPAGCTLAEVLSDLGIQVNNKARQPGESTPPADQGTNEGANGMDYDLAPSHLEQSAEPQDDMDMPEDHLPAEPAVTITDEQMAELSTPVRVYCERVQRATALWCNAADMLTGGASQQAGGCVLLACVPGTYTPASPQQILNVAQFKQAAGYANARKWKSSVMLGQPLSLGHHHYPEGTKLQQLFNAVNPPTGHMADDEGGEAIGLQSAGSDGWNARGPRSRTLKHQDAAAAQAQGIQRLQAAVTEAGGTFVPEDWDVNCSIRADGVWRFVYRWKGKRFDTRTQAVKAVVMSQTGGQPYMDNMSEHLLAALKQEGPGQWEGEAPGPWTDGYGGRRGEDDMHGGMDEYQDDEESDSGSEPGGRRRGRDMAARDVPHGEMRCYGEAATIEAARAQVEAAGKSARGGGPLKMMNTQQAQAYALQQLKLGLEQAGVPYVPAMWQVYCYRNSTNGGWQYNYRMSGMSSFINRGRAIEAAKQRHLSGQPWVPSSKPLRATMPGRRGRGGRHADPGRAADYAGMDAGANGTSGVLQGMDVAEDGQELLGLPMVKADSGDESAQHSAKAALAATRLQQQGSGLLAEPSNLSRKRGRSPPPTGHEASALRTRIDDALASVNAELAMPPLAAAQRAGSNTAGQTVAAGRQHGLAQSSATALAAANAGAAAPAAAAAGGAAGGAASADAGEPDGLQLPELRVVGDRAPLESQNAVLPGLLALLRHLGFKSAVRQLMQRIRTYYSASEQGEKDFAIQYMELFAAVDCQDTDYMMEVLRSEFQLQL